MVTTMITFSVNVIMKVRRTSGATFDPIADLYDRFASLTQDRFRRWITGVLPASGGRAIDLGCGSGRFLDLLADRYGEVVGVDASARMIDLAQARFPAVKCDVGDLWEATPERLGVFDLVLGVNTLHHLGSDPAAYLAHVRRLVRPGGQVVVVDVVRHTPRWAANPVAYRVYRLGRTVRGAVRAGVAGGSVGDALAAVRLKRHEQWRNLAADAHVLSRQEFRREYALAFPGATFSDAVESSVCAVSWSAAPGE
ncbi:class I SAM-dependent methyltransferase [Lentzea sp. NBRC 102530]|uniref:class I SAM-dependent methyltransferase n=1 Tax=Lentzea sp. NBRC 102530 TaxID=3032201 RepID=UPI00249FD5BD|nr:class I SAM-dependent methyltransferase [Lentzea sp. NBRC 102530]GLY51381.1 methyltransferase domain-containing protein [Lentzea sp. NBRC 102530]